MLIALGNKMKILTCTGVSSVDFKRVLQFIGGSAARRSSAVAAGKPVYQRKYASFPPIVAS